MFLNDKHFWWGIIFRNGSRMHRFILKKIILCSRWFCNPHLFWGSVLLYLQSPKGGCCSISGDLSCFCYLKHPEWYNVSCMYLNCKFRFYKMEVILVYKCVIRLLHVKGACHLDATVIRQFITILVECYRHFKLHTWLRNDKF